MKISNIRVYGLQESLIASGYPMKNNNQIENLSNNMVFDSKVDIKRGERLANTKIGEGHDNFLNGIIVQFDLKTNLKFWPQLQRYHFVDFVSSQSIMHTVEKINFKKAENYFNKYISYSKICELEEKRQKYLLAKEENNKDLIEEAFNDLVYNIPLGFEYTARLTTNYRQLKTIYNQRKNHKLKEWRDFCKSLKDLPMSNLFIIEN